MGTMASQITSLTSVYSTVCSGADDRKHQSSASLAFVWGIHRWPVNSPHKWPVTRKMFPFDDVIIRQIDMFERGQYIRKQLICLSLMDLSSHSIVVSHCSWLPQRIVYLIWKPVSVYRAVKWMAQVTGMDKPGVPTSVLPVHVQWVATVTWIRVLDKMADIPQTTFSNPFSWN